MDNFKKLISDKKIIIFIAIIGIAIMLIGGGDSKKEDAIEATSEEQRLMQILSSIDGAGQVRVMLTYDDRVNSFTLDKKSNGFLGAIILAEGGEVSVVKEKIIKAVQAVTGLDTHKIIVYRLGTSSQ